LVVVASTPLPRPSAANAARRSSHLMLAAKVTDALDDQSGLFGLKLRSTLNTHTEIPNYDANDC